MKNTGVNEFDAACSSSESPARAMADSSAPREGAAYGVSLGSTFAGGDAPSRGEAYAAFKYDWRAPAIDPTKPAIVRREGKDGDASAVAVEFQSTVAGERAINYRGTYVGTKRDDSSRENGVECALVFDPDTGAFTLEKIDGVVKSLRVARDLRGDAEGVGVGVNEDTVTVVKKKPRRQDPKEAAAMEQAAAAVATATEATEATEAMKATKTTNAPAEKKTTARSTTEEPTKTSSSAFAQFVSESENEDEVDTDIQ